MTRGARRLTELRLTDFKSSFHNEVLPLGRLTVLIGGNAAGKSNAPAGIHAFSRLATSSASASAPRWATSTAVRISPIERDLYAAANSGLSVRIWTIDDRLNTWAEIPAQRSGGAAPARTARG